MDVVDENDLDIQFLDNIEFVDNINLDDVMDVLNSTATTTWSFLFRFDKLVRRSVY